MIDLQNSLDQQQKELVKLKERHDEERTEWRTKHEEQIVSIEVCVFLSLFKDITMIPSIFSGHFQTFSF